MRKTVLIDKEVEVMIIGDFTGVIYGAVIALGVLLACYGTALVVSFRSHRPKPAAKSTQPVTGTGLGARPAAG